MLPPAMKIQEVSAIFIVAKADICTLLGKPKRLNINYRHNHSEPKPGKCPNNYVPRKALHIIINSYEIWVDTS